MLTSHSKENALSFTREALALTWFDFSLLTRAGIKISHAEFSHTGCLGKPADRPLAQLEGNVSRTHIRLLYPGFTDNVYGKACTSFNVANRIFSCASSKMSTRDRYQRGIVRDLCIHIMNLAALRKDLLKYLTWLNQLENVIMIRKIKIRYWWNMDEPEWREVLDTICRDWRDKGHWSGNDTWYQDGIYVSCKTDEQNQVTNWLWTYFFCSGSDVSTTFHPAFAPSAHALPSAVTSIPWPYVHDGFGEAVTWNPWDGWNGGSSEGDAIGRWRCYRVVRYKCNLKQVVFMAK